ncbi:MAG TPA: DUF3343 domain-containing protein [Clostridia bacterium]|jgi:hypothetical protein|nr:DUF3343 domain-containing protein [Clostridia bacterium]HHY06216.1 DUF3343 domain-containing protein [Clostridia bacterium]
MEYLVLFFTQSGAIKYQRFLTSQRIHCKLQPIPRKLSSSCGIAVRFRYQGDLKMLLNEDVEKIYQVEADEYILRYPLEQ